MHCINLSFTILANCGAPPPGEGVEIAISGPTSDQGDFVANEGATASYSCSDEMMLIPTGALLTCTSDGSSAAWSPAVAPTCQLGKYILAARSHAMVSVLSIGSLIVTTSSIIIAHQAGSAQAGLKGGDQAMTAS